MKAPSTARSRLGFVAIFVAIAAIGGLLWTQGGRPVGALEPRDAPASLTLPSQGEPALDDVVPVVAEVTPEAGDRNEIAGPTPAGPEPSIVPAGTEEGSPTKVRITLQPNPWLAASAGQGTLTWGTADLKAQSFQFSLDASRTGVVELPQVPLSIGEFKRIDVEGLTAEIVGWRALDPSAGPAFEIQTAWTEGATLVWAISVPLAEQVAVTVAVGGETSPPSRGAYGDFGFRDGLIQTRTALQLPLVLPRLKREESVWVGAAGREWRAFAVAPETSEVEVSLSPSATIRVLHDPPTDSSTQHVFVNAFPKGEMESMPLVGTDPILFTERPAAVHEVWVAETSDRKSRRVSRLARIEIPAGATVEVDLTARYAQRQLGGLRVHVHTTPEIIGLAEYGLKLEAWRHLTSKEVARPWDRAGDLVRIENGPASEPVYEIIGLAAGLHRVVLQPFGSRVTAEVVVGEIRDIDIYLNEIGWVKFELPEEYAKAASWTSIMTTEAKRRDRTWISLESIRNRGGRAPQPVAPGSYVAQVRVFGASKLPSLVSDPFQVQAGATTTIELRPEAKTNVYVIAHDAVTDEPIALDLKFWVKVSAVSTITEEAQLGVTSFKGNSEAYTGIQWRLSPIDEPVRIVVPENPFWTFDEVEPLRLEDELTVVLRARAK